ncbi:MAG: MotA/TolQ/ExbB proton channel family protein [Pseudomonadales bacterium]|nr:MotA/TolQ/ExbB proton channel family protein [Pseudomonadales bacterium]
MLAFVDSLQLQSFIALGGPIISILFVVACVLWLLIIERLIFLHWDYPKLQKVALHGWLQRPDTHSWCAHKIRELIISKHAIKLHRFTSTIKVLIAICPLLGLLGTVTGMVAVFDTIAITGNSDAKAMAAGIFRATLPTMSGLILALSGLYFSFYIQQKARFNTATLADQLKSRQANVTLSGEGL